MENMKLLACVFFIVAGSCQAVPIYNESCFIENDVVGKIDDNIRAQIEEKCWIIEVPGNCCLGLELQTRFPSSPQNGLEIIQIDTGEKQVFTNNIYESKKLNYSSSVKIVHFSRNNGSDWYSGFYLKYKIKPVYERCLIENGLVGTISNHITAQIKEKCWIIEVPENSILGLKLQMRFQSLTHNGLEIIQIDTGEKQLMTENNGRLQKLNYSSSVKIVHFARNDKSDWRSSFTLDYKIIRGISAVERVEESLSDGIDWMEEQRTRYWSWKENTPRAVVAMYLANAIKFTGSGSAEFLMAKETDARISVTLLRKSITLNELSIIVNSLLVTCHNPRHFYGNNLVNRLKSGIEANSNFTHPIAYLALCNADEKWPAKGVAELSRVLSDNSNYHFAKDIQAIAVMSLSCSVKRGVNLTYDSKSSTRFENAIQRFKASQLEDGSFGNAHSTALITQALIASGQELIKDWNLSGAIQYLMKAMKSPSVDFLTAYLTLPVLNGKSLVDISTVNCSESLRKHGNDTATEIHDSFGRHIRVKYSLYFGDNKNVMYTHLFQVPENFTAYQIMERAAFQDKNFKFEEKRIFGKVYVYKIANLANDSENGKFWLQYILSSKLTEEPVTKGPDELIMKDGQHLIMWYKTMNI